MTLARQCLVDTNVLLRITRPHDTHYGLLHEAINELNGQGVDLRFSLQNAAEFWNVCTRPADKNGFGLSVSETRQQLAEIERVMAFVPDTDPVFAIWRELVTNHRVRGSQVHDAHLVATMRAHGITHILTLNHGDFARCTEIQAVHPSEVPLESE
jgi:predicted nucleic acid-binding protein